MTGGHEGIRTPREERGEAPGAEGAEHLPARLDDAEQADGEPVGEERPELLPEPVPRAGGLAPAGAAPAPHAARFQFATGALAAFGAAMLVLAVALLAGNSAPPEQPWSAWQPAKDGAAGAREIAGHVGPTYRQGARQLVAVSGGPLRVAGLPVTVVLRAAPADGGNISLVEGDGVLYTLCGLGPKCAIKGGKPSPERHLLLRREALELALYSLRYLRGTDLVVVLLPPRPGADPTQAMLFRRRDMEAELDRPLRATLALPPPTVSGIAASPEAGLVQRLTGRRLFTFSLTQGQDASAFLVLEPLRAAS